jgi:hypothetical protein
VGENYFFRYEEGFRRAVFSNSFTEHPLDVYAHVHEDTVNTYRLNSKGYRSDEFTRNADLVAAGCSFTFGSGVAEEQRWSSKLASSLGAVETNLGVCAWSTHAIIQNLYAYFKEYGNPKTLVCLFPDMTRLPVALVKGFVEYDDVLEEGSRQLANVMLDRIEGYDYEYKPKYLKRPYQINDVLPVEVSLAFYMKYIHMLEAYCSAAGINFRWATWDRPMSYYLDAISGDRASYNYQQHGFENYVPMDYSDWGWDTSHDGGGMTFGSVEDARRAYSGCHSEEEAKWGDNFYIGTDVEGIVHWGTHKHSHIAERFYGSLS